MEADLQDPEFSFLSNIMPETAEEAKTLQPTLQVRGQGKPPAIASPVRADTSFELPISCQLRHKCFWPRRASMTRGYRRCLTTWPSTRNLSRNYSACPWQRKSQKRQHQMLQCSKSQHAAVVTCMTATKCYRAGYNSATPIDSSSNVSAAALTFPIQVPNRPDRPLTCGSVSTRGCTQLTCAAQARNFSGNHQSLPACPRLNPTIVMKFFTMPSADTMRVRMGGGHDEHARAPLAVAAARTWTVLSTSSMTPSMRCRLSVFMSRNSAPSTFSFVRSAMVCSLMVRSSAGSLRQSVG